LLFPTPFSPMRQMKSASALSSIVEIAPALDLSAAIFIGQR
jgi:hypothetical protein